MVSSSALRTVLRASGLAFTLLALAACGRAASPQGRATTTGASVDRPRLDRLVVAEKGSVSMVERDGCLASVKTGKTEVGANDELQVRCPKDERIKSWFDQVERVTSQLQLRAVAADDDKDDDGALPAAKVLTSKGKVLEVVRADDVKRLVREVDAFAAELATSETPTPGPASPGGWQMLHVSGTAHVLFAGTPARGVLEARVSTNGQFFCEFNASVEDSPMRATKSGYLKPQIAVHAIDQVLGSFSPAASGGGTTYAAGVRDGTETRSNPVSVPEVFERFAKVQDVLGDACLPELDAPVAKTVGFPSHDL